MSSYFLNQRGETLLLIDDLRRISDNVNKYCLLFYNYDTASLQKVTESGEVEGGFDRVVGVLNEQEREDWTVESGLLYSGIPGRTGEVSF